MDSNALIKLWFAIWEQGNFEDLPISEDFSHVSPYGEISGRQTYLDLVSSNKDKFLGHTFEIHDVLTEPHKACIRYTAKQNDFELDVSEWHYIKDNLIYRIVAYYNIPGEVREDRKIEDYS